MTDERLGKTGAVCIGRNEGERLRRCLSSLSGRLEWVVYVDSGSTDDSLDIAQVNKVEVVKLDMSKPFTAARARNAGFARLREIAPAVDFVHFFDGDCEALGPWFDQAQRTIESDDRIAAVTGRRIERYPDKTVYNRLCDLEWRWNSAYGEVEAFGGDALVRVKAFEEVKGFNPSLIAGEEPELCYRLRAKDWKIIRIDADMSLHDAAMDRISQWWQRATRSGHAYAEGAWLHGRDPERYWVRESLGIWFWALVLPVAALGGALITKGWSLLLVAAYAVSYGRTLRYYQGMGMPPSHARLYAANCVAAKFPGLMGQLTFIAKRITGRKSVLIEYK